MQCNETANVEKDDTETLFEVFDKDAKSGDKLPMKIDYDEDGNPFSTADTSVIDKLAPLDHKTLKYITVRKSFYVESEAVAKRPWSEISDLRRQKSTPSLALQRFDAVCITDISVEGDVKLKPITNFDQCNLERRVVAYLTKRGFMTPTDIQSEVGNKRCVP
jgi:hypothetical protein